MRSIFSETLETIAHQDEDLVFLTGDLGFNAFENLIEVMGDRFINAGVAEPSMISIAAGMAKMGAKPWVYSIAPFLVLRTYEQIRNDICHNHLSVKLVGNGGGYGYGTHGPTHHILEDIALFGAIPNMRVFVPAFDQDIVPIVNKMYRQKSPGYLRLARSAQEHNLQVPKYSPVRQITSGNKVSVVALGNIIESVLKANIEQKKDYLNIWSVTEMPFQVPLQLIKSIEKTKKLIVIEEHDKRGGLGEYLIRKIALDKVSSVDILHLSADSYPSKLAGSQLYHWQENGLDHHGVKLTIESICKP
jgi:transketolase